MKKIIILSILIISSIKIFAQGPHPVGSHILNSDLDKFVGTWEWSSGNETVRIVLQKQTVHFPSPLSYDEDVLVGWHQYIQNGNIQQTSLPNVGLSYVWNHPERVSLFGTTKTPNQVRFTKFIDYGKNKKCELIFTMVPNSTTQATWLLENSQGMKYGSYDYGFSMPNNLTLTKQ